MSPNRQDVPEEIPTYTYANILKSKRKAEATESSPPKKVNIREALIQSSSSGSNQKPKVQSNEQRPGQPNIESAETQPTTSSSPRSSNSVIQTATTVSTPDLDDEDIVITYRKAMHIVHAWLAWHGFGSPGNTLEPSALLLYRAERARDAAERTGNVVYVPGFKEVCALEVALGCQARMRELWEAENIGDAGGNVSGAGEYGHLV